MQADDVRSLVISAAAGDKAAWKAIVERFSGLVWAVVRAHRLSAADAEEVFQTTWLRLIEHIGEIQEPDRIGSWLATTARRETIRRLRAAQRVRPVSDLDVLDDRDENATPEGILIDLEEAVDRAERARRMWTAFQKLPDNCRKLLRLLMATPPPSYVEISDALAMRVGSIGPTRARCLERLRTLTNGTP
ncbi:MAG: RNA polymerase sigma factor [Micromonosporaceae bacterium]